MPFAWTLARRRGFRLGRLAFGGSFLGWRSLGNCLKSFDFVAF